MAEPAFPLAGKRIWVAGETGLVGKSLVRALEKRRYVTLLSAPRRLLDLTVQKDTFEWIAAYKPDVIFMAAARVGGIGANSAYPADFIRDNISIAMNVIEGAHKAGVPRLILLGSSCIYPKNASQPMREENLMTGPLETTNEAYAIAKIAALKLCQFYKEQYGRDYITAMPTNLYGPGDRFDEEYSHVIPAMILKFTRAVKEGAAAVTFWGTGKPLREFLHVDDLSAALLLMAERYDGPMPLNIGSGEEISIEKLAASIGALTGFKGRILFDAARPDGTHRKFLDSSRLHALGWRPEIALEDGLAQTCAWYRAQTQNLVRFDAGGRAPPPNLENLASCSSDGLKSSGSSSQ